ncbi:MAG: ribonuclease R [Clostridia bacterium]|nr:ribonuclease R [Clostridia bacterium]
MNHIDTLAGMTEAVSALVKSEGYVPMDMRDMTAVLTLEPDQYDLFAQAVEGLIQSGELTETKRGKLMGVEGSDRVNGVYHATSRGFGFVTPDSRTPGKTEPDFFISRDNSLGAMNGDRVQVRLLNTKREAGQNPEAEVVLVLERAVTELTGSIYEVNEFAPKTVHRKKGKKVPKTPVKTSYIVRPDDDKLTFRVRVPHAMKGDAKDGDKVLVRLTQYPNGGEDKTMGKVLRVFGEADSRAANYYALLHTHGVRTRFDEDVLAEARAIAAKPITPDGRLDLRDKIIFTIDGADAKDFDDAISIERLADGWLLGVHIADVAHYVRPGSALDREALARGTSIYFTDKVVPMLPEQLSNGVCSLNRDTDKYTLSALIKLDESGRILETSLHEAIISSKLRGVYGEVNDVIEKGETSEYWEKYAFLYPDTLPLMLELYHILAEKSDKRGALEMETVESGFVLDEDGMPVDIVRRERGDAERMIEQFMLCANEAVAAWLHDLSLPCVYRIHEEPWEEKVQTFALFAHNLGLDVSPLRRRKLTSSAYRDVYMQAKERGLDGVLTLVMLRSLMKARYDVNPTPHFGLGCELYCHFTSPIRRYPDLAVHRIVKTVLHGEMDEKRAASLADYAAEAAVKSSENELRAQNAERDIEDLYRCLYLADKVGERFDAVISSVASFGFFAEMDNTCEGLVPISSLDGYFEYNEKALSLTCGSVIYRLGDRVRVEIVSVDLSTRKVELRLAD